MIVDGTPRQVRRKPKPKGTAAFIAQTGWQVIVAPKPLLEATFNTKQQPVLILYNQPGSTNSVQTSVTVGESVIWTARQSVVLPAIYQGYDVPNPSAAAYSRAEKRWPVPVLGCDAITFRRFPRRRCCKRADRRTRTTTFGSRSTAAKRDPAWRPVGQLA
jgi:hypothetical protein